MIFFHRRATAGFSVSSLISLCLLMWAPLERSANAQTQPHTQPWVQDLPPGASIPPDYRLTTGGLLRHKSCIHQVPNGSHIGLDWVARDDNGNVLQQIQPCGLPAYRRGQQGAAQNQDAGQGPTTSPTNGWVAFTSQGVSGANLDWSLILSVFTVPSTPNDTNALNNYFTGWEPGNSVNQVLQPEVYWGDFEYGGGQYWSMLDVVQFQNNADEINSGLDTVETGDLVEFYVSYVEIEDNVCGDEMTNSGYQYTCGDAIWYELSAYDGTTTHGRSTQQQILYIAQIFNSGSDTPPNGSLFTNAFGAVFESYGDTSCEPAGEFEAISLEAFTATTNFNAVTYAPLSNIGPGANPGCTNNTATSGTTSFV